MVRELERKRQGVTFPETTPAANPVFFRTYINQLFPIRNRLHVTVQGEIGSTPENLRREFTQTDIEGDRVTIHVGDNREGWVASYQTLLELSTDERFTDDVAVFVDISDVRQAGKTLNGFGDVANPVKLPGLYQRCADILNKALGRQLNSVECCLLIDEVACGTGAII